ncbi:hypothetical protein [Microbacterium tumbae]
MTSVPRTIQVDAELQRGMTFDATVYVVTRPLAIIAYAALLAAFVVNALILPMIIAADPERATTASLTLLALVALIVGSLLFTRASARRAIVTAMPSGSVVRVSVGAERIEIVAKQGVSEVAYDAFSGFKLGRHAALLRVRGTTVVTAFPRALLDDADIAHLRASIGAGTSS